MSASGYAVGAQGPELSEHISVGTAEVKDAPVLGQVPVNEGERHGDTALVGIASQWVFALVGVVGVGHVCVVFVK